MEEEGFCDQTSVVQCCAHAECNVEEEECLDRADWTALLHWEGQGQVQHIPQAIVVVVLFRRLSRIVMDTVRE